MKLTYLVTTMARLVAIIHAQDSSAKAQIGRIIEERRAHHR